MLDFAEPARAYLSIQASSASAERLFGDAGYQEGVRRQHVETGIAEMLLTIRYLIQQRTNAHAVRAHAAHQPGALGVEATLYYQLAGRRQSKLPKRSLRRIKKHSFSKKGGQAQMKFLVSEVFEI